jgi:hypothetical protein
VSTLSLLAFLATFVGAVCLMGGAWAWIEVWRTQRRAADEARREREAAVLRADRCRRQAVIEAESRLHGRSRLSEQLVAEAWAEGVPA